MYAAQHHQKGDASHAAGEGPFPEGVTMPGDHLRKVFYRMGLNDQEIVALSGNKSIQAISAVTVSLLYCCIAVQHVRECVTHLQDTRVGWCQGHVAELVVCQIWQLRLCIQRAR